MAPNQLGSSAMLLAEATPGTGDDLSYKSSMKSIAADTSAGPKYKWDIRWQNVLFFAYLHTASIYGIYLWLFVCQWKTFFFAIFTISLASLGVTAGVHRLWSHRTYKAKLLLRIMLMIFNSMAFQNHIYEWTRDHRVHHKFTDTDADPHNATRGFFFSHIGWLLVRKHNDVKTKGKSIDLSDLEADGVVMFQKKYYFILMPFFTFLCQPLITWYFLGESAWVAWHVTGVARYTIQLNGAWLVNSAAHLYGTRPYDKTIGPAQNALVSAIAYGEGWHNYHHAFPWDYKTDEFSDVTMNVTKGFIDVCAMLGLAYDLKTVSQEMIKKRALRTGDGSRLYDVKMYGSDKGIMDPREHIWGWGDKDMTDDIVNDIKVFNKLD